MSLNITIFIVRELSLIIKYIKKLSFKKCNWLNAHFELTFKDYIYPFALFLSVLVCYTSLPFYTTGDVQVAAHCSVYIDSLERIQW